MTRKLDVASRQNITSASQSPTVDSFACTTVAAPIATSDHGCMKAPIHRRQGLVVTSQFRLLPRKHTQ